MEIKMPNIEITKTEERPLVDSNQAQPSVIFSISTDTMLFAGAFVWLLWDKLMKPTVAKSLDGVFAPIEEEKRLTAILAQIGIITQADRVVLAAFHNGQIDRFGFHLQRLTTVNQYTAPGHEPMTYPIRDLPIGRVMTEVDMLIENPGWVETRDTDELPMACRDHLKKNGINRMINRLVKVGNLPIGIISLQYCVGTSHQEDFEAASKRYSDLLEELFEQIGAIMRRRIIHPSKIRRILARFGFGLKNQTRTEQDI